MNFLFLYRTFKPGEKSVRLTGDDLEKFSDSLFHDKDVAELDVLQKLFTTAPTSKTERLKDL